MIIINYDFTTGEELSYIEGINKEDNFKTNVLTFFTFSNLDKGIDVKVLKKNGDYILLSELLTYNVYCSKELRPSHNVYKMLVSDAFEFKKKREINPS